VRQRQGRGRYGRLLTIPVVRFTAQRGRVIEAESVSGATFPLLHNGTNVTLYYDPEQPSSFMLEQEVDGIER
jgi:hypothetical protein